MQLLNLEYQKNINTYKCISISCLHKCIVGDIYVSYMEAIRNDNTMCNYLNKYSGHLLEKKLQFQLL